MLLLALPALALPPPQEARAQALFRELRCLVCQSQSLADSGAPLAADMRAVIRERIAQGESDEAIRAYLVSRYGDAILMNPPLDEGTALLWAGPALILLIGGLLAARHFRRRAS